MVEHLMAVGVVSGVIAVGSFGGAVRETVMLSIRGVYDAVLDEGVPEEMLVLVQNLGQDDQEDGGSNGICS